MVVIKVNVNGPVAWVHGIETSRRRSKSGEVTSSRNYGTNIFVNHGGSWLLEFHQSALIPEVDGEGGKNGIWPRQAAGVSR